MSLLLLHPRDAAVKRLIGDTARAFRQGSRIHPNRAPYEFYPTPPAATRALLSVEDFDGPVWEPACGQGHIARVLEAAGLQVVCTDLVDYGYGEGGRDFLAETKPLGKHIITNPPYGRGLADAFVRHALKLTRATGGKVAMLLSIDSLCHPIRHALFTSAPPKVIYCLDDCQCWPEGDPAKATTSLKRQRYCWAVWQAGHRGPAQLKWLSTR
ncbi:MAG: hypothetical protein NW215_05110 [Hyphomicrobiales bacterium]|nr:hypothetical protein [Hyphomicrobiales bacterium]